MIRFLKNLWASAYNLPLEQRRKTVRVVTILAALAIIFVLLSAAVAAFEIVPAESPTWEAILQSRLALVRLALSVPIVLLGWFTATVLYQTYEHTYLGKRTVVWMADQDGKWTEEVEIRAQKTRNSGTLQAALKIACILGLLLAVLR